MWATTTLPDSDSLSNAQRIADLAGVEYCGQQAMEDGTLHYFREIVTGTSLAVWDQHLTVASLQSSMKVAHVRFGVEVRP